MSIAVGSATLSSRCMRTPIWRCSRTACWAAAIDFARPIVIGITVFGNSTRFLTGRMMMASAGISGDGAVAVVLVPVSATGASLVRHLGQRDDEAAVDVAALNVTVVARGQPQPPLEPSLRQLEAMDHGVAQLGRHAALADDDEVVALDHGDDVFRVD